MDAGKYYALLRFEEAAVALRAALELGIVDRMGSEEFDLEEFGDLFEFTHQGARTYAYLLEVMEVLERSGRTLRVSPRALETLSEERPTSRRPYLMIGTGDDVDVLIEQLRGNFPEQSLPLYGRDNATETLMDLPDAAREIAVGLASRARNFAEPLADAIRPYAGKSRILADLGAGSPHVAVACLASMPQLKKVILVDRPNGMLFAREMAQVPGIIEKVEYREADFFEAVPPADIYCISNTAHDWLPEECVSIMMNVRDSIASGGLVCIHEPLMRDHWSSAEEWIDALWMACYALALYRLTQGKGTCYTQSEHNAMMGRCTFGPVGEPIRTRDGCTALFYRLQSDIAQRESTLGETRNARQQASSPSR